ncbi:TonB-dependent receptor plug domain-containing protein [Pseudoduganella umbonata]|uniref:Iron complex outermembrane receptor protein n=1 Tax=Pseudoduganella umbonata TaxID=864828 RepID=A0A4V1EDJ9_9BURK|nr:TonB-dependent receptor [Pseudoduganella umbonata]MBB3224278.1 iron complex outermembrane receptor protein [Pseudoduganella umbonata]QCP11341.1 TonB-dependent receptor [Pseudoduganella umbonata]
MSTLRLAVLSALYGSSALVFAPAALAQAQPASEPVQVATPQQMQTVSIVGSRRATSSATDTVVPIDVIPLTAAAEKGGQFDLSQTLTNISPSFNSTRQSGADGADLVDSAALRGLGSDQTLVLVNGKRRHTSSLVNLFGARNRGNTGTDLNAIPMLAIRDVQVLRDGAAAQYGSDAIAGVMDIGLKKSLGCEAVTGYGQYSAGDGENWLASAYCGIALGGGVVGITAEYLDRGRSDRSEPDNPRIIGDSKTENQTLYVNGEIPTGVAGGTGRFYFTGGVQKRDASSAAFGRGGVGTDDIPSRNSAAMYPDGFVPFINGDMDDRTAILGHRARLGEWNADISQTYGYNRLMYDISNTLNASIANADLLAGGQGISPDHFDAGGFSFEQWTTNADFARYFDGVLGKGLNVAFGAEYRVEKYKIFAGEPGSYVDADGLGNGGNAGSQGFPGFQPGDVTNARRHSTAAYLDMEADLTDAAKVQGAVRWEKYSDFGSTVTGKLAGSYRVAPAALLRASASTGFRAPSLQQAFFSSTFTDFIGGVPTDVVLAPNGGAVARLAGIPNLKEEKSTSFTLGTTWTPTPAISVTADLYHIKIKDRIVLSGRFDADNYPELAARLSTLGVGQAQFFVNSVDTKTQGLDLTASHRGTLFGNRLTTFLAANFSKTTVEDIHAPASLAGFEDVLLSERERLFIEQGGPRRKATLGFNYVTGPLDTDFKIIHFGPQTLGTFSGTAAGVPNLHYEAKTSADLSLSYSVNQNIKFTAGANNIFSAKPTPQNADETDNGFKYDSVQFGLNGTSYFARLHVKF